MAVTSTSSDGRVDAMCDGLGRTGDLVVEGMWVGGWWVLLERAKVGVRGVREEASVM